MLLDVRGFSIIGKFWRVGDFAPVGQVLLGRPNLKIVDPISFEGVVGDDQVQTSRLTAGSRNQIQEIGNTLVSHILAHIWLDNYFFIPVLALLACTQVFA